MTPINQELVKNTYSAISLERIKLQDLLKNMREIEKKDQVKPQNNLKLETKETKTLSYEEQKKQKSLQNKLSKIESQINELEKAIQKDDENLARNYEKLMEDASFFSTYEKKKKDLEQLMEDWENVQNEIELF